MDKKFVEDAISNLKEQLEHCNSINEYLDLVYSFNFRDLTINPFQIKNEIATLLKILKLKKSKIVLEIGTANGGTLFLFSKVCPPDMTLISIDLPEGPFGGEFFPDWKIPFYKSFATQQQKIHIIRADSHNSKTLDEIKVLLNGKKIDFLFIDGDHGYESVKKDLELYGEFLSDDGIIAIHDISSGPEENVGEVPKFWKEIKSKHESLEILDNDNTLGYGIGLLFPNETKIQSREYVRILKTVLKNQNSVIQKIEKQLNEEIKKLVEKTPYEIQTHKKKVLDISQNLQEKEAEITNGKDYISKLKNAKFWCQQHSFFGCSQRVAVSFLLLLLFFFHPIYYQETS